MCSIFNKSPENTNTTMLASHFPTPLFYSGFVPIEHVNLSKKSHKNTLEL